MISFTVEEMRKLEGPNLQPPALFLCDPQAPAMAFRGLGGRGRGGLLFMAFQKRKEVEGGLLDLERKSVYWVGLLHNRCSASLPLDGSI